MRACAGKGDGQSLCEGVKQPLDAGGDRTPTGSKIETTLCLSEDLIDVAAVQLGRLGDLGERQARRPGAFEALPPVLAGGV